MWIYLGLLAALFLGLHSLCKKHAVQGNEAFPVLLGTITSGFMLLLPLYIGSIYFPEFTKRYEFLYCFNSLGNPWFYLYKINDNGSFLGISLPGFKTFTNYYCCSYTLCRSIFYIYRCYLNLQRATYFFTMDWVLSSSSFLYYYILK